MISDMLKQTYADRLISTLTNAIPEQPSTRRSHHSLPEMSAELSQTSVSGVSSGGAMAIQLHIAHSAHMKGIGVTAGVAYDSADSRLPLGLRLLRGAIKSVKGIAYHKPNSGEVRDFSIERTKEAFKAGGIDDPKNLKTQRVWLFHGTKDKKIARQAMDGVRKYYRNYIAKSQVFYMDDIDAPHGQVTDDFGDLTANPNSDHHIVDLDYDTPGRLLELIYGSLDEVKYKSELNDLIEFDQSEFIGYCENGRFKRILPERVGMAETGFLYIPRNFQPGHRRIHVAFHGCDQYADETMEFVRNSGYNQWADLNNIVVLYPQTTGTSSPFNPKGCWDWFGYGKPEKYRSQYARQNGYQISAVWRMLERLQQGDDNHPHTDVFNRPIKVKGDVTDISVAIVWKQNRAAHSFDVHRKAPCEAGFTKINDGRIKGPSYVDRTLKKGTTYQYRIRVFDESGNKSNWSDVLTIKTLPPKSGQIMHYE